MPTMPETDMNAFHARHGHAHEGQLRETAQQIGVRLVGQLEECEGCSMAKDLGKPIKLGTLFRSRPISQGLDSGEGRREFSVLHSVVVERVKTNESDVESSSGESDGSQFNSPESDGSQPESAQFSNVQPNGSEPSSSASDDSQVVVDARTPAATPAATPVGRVTPAANASESCGDVPAAYQSSGASASPSDVSRDFDNPSSSSSGKDGGDKIPLPLEGRSAAQLRWDGLGPSGTVRGRTRGDSRARTEPVPSVEKGGLPSAYPGGLSVSWSGRVRGQRAS